MSVATFLKVQWELARRIGRKDFDGAISALERALDGGLTDAQYLEMIAQCHYWAKREEMAIASARRALHVDPKAFGAMKFLSEVYARRGDHDTAAEFARQALEHYPEPLPETPKTFLRVLRAVSFMFPRLKPFAARTQEDIGNPNKSTEQWYAWAKEFLAWYDQTRGAQTAPTIH
jgi:tetratricopeptide (TPR) repeat protein